VVVVAIVLLWAIAAVGYCADVSIVVRCSMVIVYT
jgi:hypothetical protein